LATGTVIVVAQWEWPISHSTSWWDRTDREVTSSLISRARRRSLDPLRIHRDDTTRTGVTMALNSSEFINLTTTDRTSGSEFSLWRIQMLVGSVRTSHNRLDLLGRRNQRMRRINRNAGVEPAHRNNPRDYEVSAPDEAVGWCRLDPKLWGNSFCGVGYVPRRRDGQWDVKRDSHCFLANLGHKAKPTRDRDSKRRYSNKSRCPRRRH